MRPLLRGIAVGLLTLAVGLSVAMLVVDTQPKYSAQLHNAYWPYSVETQIRDK